MVEMPLIIYSIGRIFFTFNNFEDQMNIAIATMYTPNIKKLASITIDSNKTRYSIKHNYDLIVKTKDFEIKHLGFEKINLLRKLLASGKYDWIYWCGCDTMITNFNIKLEDLIDNDYCFIISKDVWDFNSDSFLCRNSVKTLDFFDEILSLHDYYVDSNGIAIDRGSRLPNGAAKCWAEQEAIIDLYPKYKEIIKVLPQKKLNSYLYHLYSSPWHQKAMDADGNPGHWSVGDFLLHLPGMDNNNRINICLSILDRIIGDENDK